MGNVSSMARASTALDSYVAELGNEISYDKGLSSSRFLKTILARHADGPLVLKIFIKPDPSMSLRLQQRRLKNEREALADLPGANTYQMFVETEKAGYLVRQWIGANLYDRVSIQPYLTAIEKKWIAFQLITCLRDARIKKVSHGDIKSENVLVTSDLAVLLTDFSHTFKPTYLPIDDPSDYAFFFDTSGRRTCYLAPERFETKEQLERRQGEEKRRLEERRKRKLAAKAGDVDDAQYRPALTEEMDVFSAGCVLAEMWTDGRTVFNLSELFAYRDGASLEGILDNIDDVHVRDMITQMLSREPGQRPKFDLILAEYRGTIFPEYFYTFLEEYLADMRDPGAKIDRMLSEWESISVQLEGEGAALLLLNHVTSGIRNCLWPSQRLHGLQLFLKLGPYVSDEDKIDRIVPFIVELLTDSVAIVRAEACRALVTIVESVTSGNAAYIPEYLLPQLRQLASDDDVFVRATYARSLVRLADVALAMLEYVPRGDGVDYDVMLLEIQAVVEEQATLLLTDPSVQVKRATLSSIADLCLFFGRQKSSETVLSHLVTYLNDRDWTLRFAFFEGIVEVGAFIGLRAVEEYVLPLMLQALSDAEEAVVARVIMSLTNLASLGLLARQRIWDVFQAVRALLCHPNSWIRQSSAGLIAAAARALPPSDVWCILYPALRVLLHSDVLAIDEGSILAASLQLSRTKLVAARMAALENSPPGFWRIAQKGAKASMIRAALTESPSMKDKGITPADDRIISVMKDFIFKQAHAIKAREAIESESALMSDKAVSLEKLGVTAQTVFISPRTVEIERADLRRLRPLLDTSRRSSVNPLDEIRQKLSDFPQMPVDRVSLPRSESSMSTSRTVAVQANASKYGTSYEGNDPAVKAFLEQVDLETYREPLLDFGPRVAHQRKRRKTTGAGSTLIAHLTQHAAPITAIVTSPDHLFFVTAAADKTVLVWDTSRLERSVSAQPRLRHAMDAPVTAMCRIENTHCLAVAAEEQLQVLRVHATGGKYSRIEVIRSWTADSEITFIAHHASTIALLDMRGMTITRQYQHPLEFGRITAVHPSTDWLVVGTELGVLSLWDLRFGLLLKSWRASGGVSSLQIHPSRPRWIMCGAEQAVEVYDIETSKLVEVYGSERRTEFASREIPSRRELIAELGPSTSTLALLAGRVPSDDEAGYLVTAGEDRVVRYYDLSRPADGMVICGSPKQKDVAFKNATAGGVGVHYTVPRDKRSDRDKPLRPHYDAICALGAVETGVSNCVISGDRSGIVKVWRVENLGSARSL